jgi:hypothetical protein
VSSTNKRWETLSAPMFLASMKMTNNKGDKGSPYLKPQELLKNPEGLSFTKTEKCTEEIQNSIQECHFSPKPHLLNKYN